MKTIFTAGTTHRWLV